MTVCHVSVKGSFFFPLLLFLMGNLDQLRKSLFREQGKRKFHPCAELIAQYDYFWEESLQAGANDLDLLVAVFFYGNRDMCRCSVHVIN